MVFFTGVTFLNRNNAFSSSLNNLLDLSLYGNTQKLVGFTQSELEHYFAKPLAGADKEKVRRWYNGYSWGRTEKLYNPRSILRFFASGGAYQSFWSETRLPTPLLKKMKKEVFQESIPVETSQMMLSTFDIHRVDIVPLLFQTGCLTMLSTNQKVPYIRSITPTKTSGRHLSYNQATLLRLDSASTGGFSHVSFCPRR